MPQPSQLYAQGHAITQVWEEVTGVSSGKFGVPTAIDHNDNFYKAGFANQALGGKDAKLMKYDTEGNLLWDVKLNPVSTTDAYEPSRIVSYGGHIYATGAVTYLNNGESDFFVARIDQYGNVLWFVTDISNGNDATADIYYDSRTYKIYISGATERNGTYDMLLAAYDANGNQNWLSTHDYNGNADLATRVYHNGSNIVVHGSSQSNPLQWDISTWYYQDNGSFISQERKSGINTASSELKDAVLNNGYLNLSGYSFDGSHRKFKVVCLDAANNYMWSDEHSKNNGDAEGKAIVASSNAFASTGYVTQSAGNQDILVRKYGIGGNLIWNAEIDEAGANDKGIDILEDVQGNYLVLADAEVDAQTDVYLHYLQGSTGNVLWSQAVAENSQLNENAVSMESGMDGRVYVTYTLNNEALTIAYNYSETNFTPDSEPFSKSNFYLTNKGQLLSDKAQTATGVRYYSTGLYPDYFFSDEGLRTVFYNYDASGRMDKAHRIDFDFKNAKSTHVGQLAEYQQQAHFNYYVGDAGFEKLKTFNVLAYPQVYDNVNAYVSTNSEGFKLTLVLESGADLNHIALDIKGASSTSLVDGELHVGSMHEDVVWMKPYSYLRNSGGHESDGCITYSLNNGILSFSSSCELQYPYVIQLKTGTGKQYAANNSMGNLNWSTFYGGNGADYAVDVEGDPATGDLFVAGDASSIVFPDSAKIDNTLFRQPGAAEAGIILKFDYNARLLWGTVITGPDFGMIMVDMDLYDNVPPILGKEVHIIGNYKGTYKPRRDDKNAIPSGAYQQVTPHNTVLNGNFDLLYASFRNDLGIRLVTSPLGGLRHDKAEGMEISPGGLMYFYGTTQSSGSATPGQGAPISYTFPVYDPGDGSYYEYSIPGNGSNRPYRAFVSALNLQTYLLDYSSIIRKDPTSSKSEFEVIYDMDFEGNSAAYAAKGLSGARLGKFNTATHKFAPALDQTHSEFSSKTYFSSVVHTPQGTVYVGMDDNGSNGYYSNPSWQNFQTSIGQAYMLMIDDNDNIVWDSYFGEGQQMGFYWHGGGANFFSGTPPTFGKGKLAYSPSVSTFFMASSSGSGAVQTKDHPNFFYEPQNVTAPSEQRQGDINLSAFYTANSIYLANHTWGTHYGGNGLSSTPSPFNATGTEYLGDLTLYDHNNKTYAIAVGSSMSDIGITMPDDAWFPVVDYGRPNSWYKDANYVVSSNYHVAGHQSDMVISRFEVTGIAQGALSEKEALLNTPKIRIFPNPAASHINISILAGINIENLIIQNMAGKVLLQQHLSSGTASVQLDISTLASGVYMLTLNQKEHVTFVKH